MDSWVAACKLEVDPIFSRYHALWPGLTVISLVKVLMRGRGPGWSRTVIITLPPCWAPKVRNGEVRAPRVEGTLDNNIGCDPYPCGKSISSIVVVGCLCGPCNLWQMGISPYHQVWDLVEYTRVGILPTSQNCWDWSSPSGQRVEVTWDSVWSLPDLVSQSRSSHGMQVFYHLTLEVVDAGSMDNRTKCDP